MSSNWSRRVKMRSRILLRPLHLAALLLMTAGQSQAQSSCSVVSENIFVRNVMTDLYLWSDKVPALDPAAFTSPEAFLEAARYRDLDSHYSYIDDRAASDAFFSESQFIGFGFSSLLETQALRVSQVFADSPAAEAGLQRGDRILEIDGRAVSELVDAGLIASAFGPPTVGTVRTLLLAKGEERRVARLEKRAVTIPTVSEARVFQVGARRVGYLFFRNFVEPSFAALESAFSTFQTEGVDELVLDLRYNGGGMVTVAQYLASLIGGTRTSGQILGTYSHNRRNSYRNADLRMSAEPHSLGLDRLVVIATGSSASASELIVNGLRPFIPVAIIGQRTYGKPVGQYAIPFCDKILAAVAFSIRNANNEGDYYEGLQATCLAPDDLEHQLGDPAEASLAASLAFLSTGACQAPPAQTTGWHPRLQRPQDAATGLRQLIQAH